MGESCKVFIIDDDAVALKAIAKKFRPYDVEVFTFSDPYEGLEAIREHRPQVVFLDYHMPVLSGEQMIIKISEAKLFTDCSLYLLSGMEFNKNETIKLKTLGFYEILTKPLTQEKIDSVFKYQLGEVPLKAS